MKAMLIVVPMLLVAGLTGCAGEAGRDSAAGEYPAAPATATTALPEGRTFVSTGVTAAGQPKALVTGTTIRLQIQAADKISVQAGCNTAAGPARIEGTKLVVEDFATTEVGCEQALQQQDEWIHGFFTARPTWQLTGNDLVLTTADLEMKLTDRAAAEPARSLVDTKWTLNTIVGTGGTASSVPVGVTATMTFTADGRVSGSTGCNSFGGTATIAGNKITFGDVASTRRACNGAAGSLEADVLRVLNGAATFRIEGDRLILDAPDGSGLQFVG
jgi:heat shock protein HslJ